jgi:hypothetical protein
MAFDAKNETRSRVTTKPKFVLKSQEQVAGQGSRIAGGTLEPGQKEPLQRNLSGGLAADCAIKNPTSPVPSRCMELFFSTAGSAIVAATFFRHDRGL